MNATNAISVRPIAPAEEPRFVERVIENAWLALHPDAQARLVPTDIAPALRELIPLLMEQGDNVILVADDGAVRNIGQAWLGQARDPYTGTLRGFLYDLYIEEAHRGRGIGHALLEAVEQAAHARGDAEIGLAVAANNPAAQALYAAHGFTTERLMLVKTVKQ